MKAPTWVIFLLIICCAGSAVLVACADDDDDDDDNNDDQADDDAAQTGVCYYECEYFTNTTITQAYCYDTSGTGSLAQEGFDNEADCQAYAQERCAGLADDAVVSNLLFSMDCASCDETACEPDWWAVY